MPIDERFSAHKLGSGIESCDLYFVIAEVQIIQPIPVEVLKKMQLCFPSCDLLHWVIPVAARSTGPWILNHDWYGLARWNDLEKWDGNLEDVVYGAFFLQLRQDEFAEDYPLNFIELLGRIPIPEDLCTNLAFGGPERKELYVTSGKTIFKIPLAVSGYALFPRL